MFYNMFNESADELKTKGGGSKDDGNRLIGKDPVSGKNVYSRIAKFWTSHYIRRR